MWTSEHHPRLLKKELLPTCKLMNHPRWIPRLMPDHPLIGIQVWYLVPQTPDDPERNQTERGPHMGLQKCFFGFIKFIIFFLIRKRTRATKNTITATNHTCVHTRGTRFAIWSPNNSTTIDCTTSQNRTTA